MRRMHRDMRRRADRDGRTHVHGYYRRDNAPEDMNRDYSRDYTRDYSRDYARDYRDYDSRYDSRYDSYDRDRRYNDYDYANEDEDYERDLNKWTKKLMKKDKTGVDKNTIISRAKQMGINFEDYTEEEFFATYLMMVSDYYDPSQDYIKFIVMAQKFLEDDDAEITGSDKLCEYMYSIVMGK